MSRISISIVDYGVGNHTSVLRSFQSLGYRCRITCETVELSDSDLIVLPGVGAYPAAMAALHARGLVDFLCQHARAGKPMLGLCLGMQLFADHSFEHGTTAGLGLIPGGVIALKPDRWHIGWNSIEVVNDDKLLLPSDGVSVYFNHSYFFDAPTEYQLCLASLERPFPVGVRSGNIVGLQFHPEKSQHAGRVMLRNLVEGLARA